MTGRELRLLDIGARVVGHGDSKDAGTVIERDWAGVVIKWDNREQQKLLHDMVERLRANEFGRNLALLIWQKSTRPSGR